MWPVAEKTAGKPALFEHGRAVDCFHNFSDMIQLRRLKACLIFAILPILAGAQEFGGHPPSVKWKQLNSSQARVIFPVGLDSQANRIYTINQLLNRNTAASIGGRQRKWNIVLLNQTTIPNAYVRMAPIVSELYMTPAQDNFSTGSLRWDDNLIIHENRHIQQLSNFRGGLTDVFSFFLGQEGQLLANGITIPDYFFEGDAVLQETLVSGQGRGRMPSFYNGMKSLWLGNKNYSWMKLRSGSLKDYTPDFYELGYQLVAYGAEKYGTDFWKKVTTDAVRFKGIFYSFNRAIERHSGEPYETFRQNALAFFKEKNLPAASNKQTVDFLTPAEKNNVVDYLFPVFAGNDSIIVTKKSYRSINRFYLLNQGREKMLRVKDAVIDDYFSYRDGKIAYAAYKPDPRWGNRNFSVIQLFDIQSGQQIQLTHRSNYFSPDISPAGTELIAVNVKPDGTNNLHRLDSRTGVLIASVPNPENYFFTQTKYFDANSVVAAVRTPGGKMCLVKVDLVSGITQRITPLSYNVIGYPLIKGDTVFFSAMHEHSDKVFAVKTADPTIFRVTNNQNGVYHPAVNNRGEMIYSAFTAEGSRLGRTNLKSAPWQEISAEAFAANPVVYTPAALSEAGAGILEKVQDSSIPVTKYRKSFQLFNFHSWRPEVNDPEYSYHLYSDNVLSSFSNSLSYTFNRADRSHKVGFYEAFAGWFPVLTLGGEYHFNRNLDTAVGKTVAFNSAKINAGFYIPLSFVGRTSTNINFGAGYNMEQLFYRGIGKNVFDNKSVKYTNLFFSLTNAARKARQHINPRWAQSFSLSYRDAFTLINSHKFVGNSALYFPGLSVNHSTVINFSYQKRDSLPDLFSNNFSYSRGYDALSTRQMYKLGVNYHLPLFYPDWGVGNMIFFQRVRTNAFYDHTVARARVNGILTDVKNRSTGAELFFDTKVWNALPVSFGVRFSHLLDRDLRNPGVKNLWEFIVPIGLIPD